MGKNILRQVLGRACMKEEVGRRENGRGFTERNNE
jgi:hypothetical protein